MTKPIIHPKYIGQLMVDRWGRNGALSRARRYVKIPPFKFKWEEVVEALEGLPVE